MMNVAIDYDELKKHSFYIFGEGHYNTLGIARSLGEYGIKSISVTTGGNRKLVESSKYVKEKVQVSSIDEGYHFLIQRIRNEKRKPFIFTSDDRATSYFDERYDELSKYAYFFNAGENGKITKYMAKDLMYNLAEQCGLKVLKNITTPREVVPEITEYPVLTKGVDSIKVKAWKNDVHICNNAKELQEAFKTLEAPVIMVQKYIHKKNELCMEGFSCRKGKDLFISIASTYNYILDDSYSPYMTVKNFKNIELFKPLSKMFEEIGFEGIFEIEFLEDQDGQLYFGEINFRNSTWSYASTCAGMPLPVLWAQSMLDGKQVENCLVEIPEGFTAMVEFDDLRRRVKTHQISFSQWFKDYRRADCLYYTGKKDFKPVVSELMQIVKRKVGIGK